MNKFLITASAVVITAMASFNIMAQTPLPDQESSRTELSGIPKSEASNPTNGIMPMTAPAETMPPAIVTAPPPPTDPVPVPMVMEMPKADQSFFDHMVDAIKNKDFNAIVDHFSNDNFIVVTEKGELISSKESLKAYYTQALSEFKTPTINVDMSNIKITDVAPGVAMATAKVTTKLEADKPPMECVLFTTLKYEDGSWKIIAASKHMIRIEPAHKPHENCSEGGMFKMLATLIIGIVAGYFGFKYMGNRKQL